MVGEKKQRQKPKSPRASVGVVHKRTPTVDSFVTSGEPEAIIEEEKEEEEVVVDPTPVSKSPVLAGGASPVRYLLLAGKRENLTRFAFKGFDIIINPKTFNETLEITSWIS